MSTTPTTPSGTEQPIALYSHNLTHPGIPLTSLISAVALLLSARGVIHDLPIDPLFTSESMVCGNPMIDNHFSSAYMEFNMLLDSLTRQYNTVQCKARSNGTSIMMTFSCY